MFKLLTKNKGNTSRKKWRWFGFFFVGLSLPIVYVVWKVSFLIFLITGFQPSEMARAQYTPKDVIGDLGGMKVIIPRHYAEYVEYDGDPRFGEKRKGPRPERTFDSRLRSFGMDVRFPDMKGLENAQIREEMRRQPLKENSWLRISIIGGEDYPGEGFLDRSTDSELFNTDAPEYNGHWSHTYARMSDTEYGLEAWYLSGIDPRTGKPARESSDTSDIYLYRDAYGKIDVYITCSRPSVPEGIGTCNVHSVLGEKAAFVLKISFRRGLLPEWQNILQSARELLLSFKVKQADKEMLSPSQFTSSPSR
ncbi:MAG: hypothetical protein LBI68_01400 [Azoarcus sp.]|jgi:hypothetical protein|nr:hypothetical protein [Azoarcus sp.]